MSNATIEELRLKGTINGFIANSYIIRLKNLSLETDYIFYKYELSYQQYPALWSQILLSRVQSIQMHGGITTVFVYHITDVVRIKNYMQYGVQVTDSDSLVIKPKISQN